MTPAREAKIKKVLAHRQPDLTVVLENVHDPHNISAVMRTCDAVGVQELYILNNMIAPHKKFGKKSSASAAGWLTIHQHEDTASCMAEVTERYKQIYATHLGSASVSLYELHLAQPVALVFGNEHEGISKETLSWCHGNFVIPQAGMIQSLNISVACAVALYEAFRQKQQAGHYNGHTRLPQQQADVLATRWGLHGKGNEEPT